MKGGDSIRVFSVSEKSKLEIPEQFRDFADVFLAVEARKLPIDSKVEY